MIKINLSIIPHSLVKFLRLSISSPSPYISIDQSGNLADTLENDLINNPKFFCGTYLDAVIIRFFLLNLGIFLNTDF